MLYKNIKNKYKKIIFIFFLGIGGIFFIFPTVLAQVSVANTLGVTFGLTTRNLFQMVINFTNALLGFLGIIAVSTIIYGGFIWMTSKGIPEKIEKAKKILINAVIGLGIILLSFAIVQFINSTGNNNPKGTTIPKNGGGDFGSLGAGIIESVYPAPNALNVPRNTSIVVTFKEAMDPDTIINDTNGNGILGDWIDSNSNGVLDLGEYDTITGGINPNIKIALQGQTITGPWIINVFVNKTIDNKTFIFKPIDPLGNSTIKIWYSTYLTSLINKADGTSALGVAGYTWSYEIGTFLDNTPPRVISVRPIAGGTYDRNIVIQMIFSEAINPLAVNSNNIIVEGISPVSGTLYIANQYKTIEFLGAPCGVNSCNETIYCLPALENITTTILASDCGTTCPETLIRPFNGIVDMANNSLDGNADGVATGPIGPPSDNYVWDFQTNDNINLISPTISSITPTALEKGVGLSQPIKIVFSNIMMHSSLTTSNIKIILPVVSYWIEATNSITQTTVNIFHSKFSPATQYKTEVNSAVKNEYQSCFYPSSSGSCLGSPYCCDNIPSTTPCP